MFTTKAYTISRLIKEVSSLNNNQTTSVVQLANSLSPRAGTNSAKLFALNQFLNGNLSAVIAGTRGYSRYGKTSRSRIVAVLRNRKNA